MGNLIFNRVSNWIAITFFILFILATGSSAASYPVLVKDSAGNSLKIEKRPTAVVSLVPSITEMIFALGSQDAVTGVTYHDSRLLGAQTKQIVGGYFSPSLKTIKELNPDLLIVSPGHTRISDPDGSLGKTDTPENIVGSSCRILVMDSHRMDDYAHNLRLLGQIFDKKKEAQTIIDHNYRQINLIKEKISRISPKKRQRVIRLMGRDKVMTPGDDSFQNEMIAAAGGIPPYFGKKGDIISLTLDEWQKFNPQVIYGCGQDRQTAKSFFKKPGWKDVDAVKNGRVYFFPCDLTCRAATNTGYFVSWLSGVIYADEFADPATLVQSEEIAHSRPIDLDLPYIKNVKVAYSNIYDFVNKSLIIDFISPQTIVSTLEGQRSNILTVGNHFSPPASWNIDHNKGLDGLRNKVFKVIGVTDKSASFLFTGADMDNLVIKKANFRDIEVTALVTAGVESNAQRMSKDSGDFYEPDYREKYKPGTINILILTNTKLTPSAMTRAIITATEAKTAALWDMDIRSSYTPTVNPATGTGTDNILVVQGDGEMIKSSGGHTKMGEIIASAVYAGVQEAILKQNKLTPARNIFDRLKERKLSIYSLASAADCECVFSKAILAGAVEETLLDRRWSSYLESALLLSDGYEKGLVSDPGSFNSWSESVASDIAGADIKIKNMIQADDIPVILKTALNAVFTGVQVRLDQDQSEQITIKKYNKTKRIVFGK